MSFNQLAFKITRKFKAIFAFYFFQLPRLLKYKILSNCQNIIGKPVCNQPVLFMGGGRIVIGENVHFGVKSSQGFYNSYSLIDARNSQSNITIHDNVGINNNLQIICETEITIHQNTLIGVNVEITDSDFHDLHPNKRRTGTPKTAKVTIGKNVFVGSNVKILKGVTIGDNSVIANSSVVTKSIPANVIAGGYPAKVIKEIDLN